MTLSSDPDRDADRASVLSPSELDLYRKQGFVVRERVFRADEVERLRAAVEDVHARIVREARRDAAPVETVDERRYQTLLESRVKWEWEENSHQIRSMEPVVHLHSELDALIDDARLVRPCAGLLEFDALALFTDKLNFKRPGGSPFPWHQDAPYWAFGCTHLDRLVSLQLYLDDAVAGNGCLWVVPGSHRHGVLPSLQNRGVLGRLYTDLSRLPDARPVALEAPAGSVIFFDGYVVHGSRGNRGTASRRALVLTYQPGGHPRWGREDERPVRAAAGPADRRRRG